MNSNLAFVCVLIVGTGISIAVPELIDNSLTAPNEKSVLNVGAPVQSANIALATIGEEAVWNDSLTLQRERDGHFYAEVSVDGQAARMLIDTGASVIALTGEDAAAMGIGWDETEVAQVAQGANGPVYGVHTVLAHVALGSFEADNVPAIIVPEGLFVSLLGQSFLSKVGKVEIAGDALVMSS